MGCMKCGRDVDPDQVFCDQCREVMARYPVKPGVVVQLPHRHQQPVKKQPARRHPVLSTEEHLNLLRRMVRRQILLIVILLAMVIGLSWLSVRLYLDGEKKVLPGQNYYSNVSSETKETTSPTTEITEPTEYGVAG